MTFDCGIRRVCGKRAECGLPVGQPLRAHQSAIRNRQSAFTLVELLIVITIIGILSSMLLGAASLSMGSARQARTEALITRLHTLLSQHYDTFRTRRVEVQDSVVAQRREDLPSNLKQLALAQVRYEATREQLKMELPDRWSDLLGQSIGASDSDTGEPMTTANTYYLKTLPSITQMYLRRYERIRLATNTITGLQNTAGDLRRNQGAECLYLIIMLAAGDGESAGLFKESDIGDTDGDGAPEFIDAWGQPIQLLRWAPGFDSDVQLNAESLARLVKNRDENLTPDEVLQKAVAEDRSPFDLFRVDRFDAGETPRGFRLAPLIYSGGSDKEFGVDDRPTFFNALSDPYYDLDGNTSNADWVFLGAITDRATATDNVHNHYLEGR